MLARVSEDAATHDSTTPAAQTTPPMNSSRRNRNPGLPDQPHLSPLSLAAHRKLPSRQRGSSYSLRWRSVLARSYDDPVEAEAFSTAATPDLLVTIALNGAVTIQCERPRGWKKTTLRPGAVGVTAPGTSSTLRWQGATRGLASLHLHLSADLLTETARGAAQPQTC